MSYKKIIFLIAVIIGILLFQRTKPNILKGILIGLILSIGIPFFENELLTTISFLSFGVLVFIFSIHRGFNKKWLSLIIGLFAFILFFFRAMYFPYINELRLSMLIPILCYMMIFKKWELYKTELSILTILVAYELSEFIKLVELWLN